MAIQPAFLLIADIGGYTRFMKMHRMSLAHAHDIIAQLLEAIIDATRGRLTLAKLEGDAAFFYVCYPNSVAPPNLAFVADAVARIYMAFHSKIEELKVNRLCACEGCEQAANLKVKFAGHFGEAAIHKVKRLTELAGVDVILVHRMLKNDVPVPEYLLMTEPVMARLDDAVRQRAAAHPMELDDLGKVDAYFMDVASYAGDVPPKQRRSLPARLGATLMMIVRTLPYFIGLRRPCAEYKNMAASG